MTLPPLKETRPNCRNRLEAHPLQGNARTGHGNGWLRTTLVEAAWAAWRSKNTYLSTQYHRLAARRGGKRAAVAVAHRMLVTIYHMLKSGASYHDLGGNYFDERNQQLVVKRAVRRTEPGDPQAPRIVATLA